MACLHPAHQWHEAEEQDSREAARIQEACRAAENHLDRALSLQLAKGALKNALGAGTVSDCATELTSMHLTWKLNWRSHAAQIVPVLLGLLPPSSCQPHNWWVGCGVLLMLPLLMCRLMT